MSLVTLQINKEQVQKVLKWSMVCEAVEEAMKAVAHAQQHPSSDSFGPQVNQPPRSLTTCGSPSQILLTMPGYVSNYRLATSEKKGETKISTLGCKLVTSFAGNTERVPPLPKILANILLFSTQTGQLECIMDGTDITAWRTAAASIVATKYLYFSRYPEGVARSIKVAIIGTGVQGESHALGMCATFTVTDIYLWNRTPSKAEAVANKLRTVAPLVNVHVKSTPAEAVTDADVICVGTYASTALITYSMLTKSQIHINTVGAGQVHYGEVGQDVYQHATVYIDSWANARTELNGLKADIISEVGEVINTGKSPQKDGITIFQSMGMAAEDVTVAQAVYNAVQTTTD